MLYNYLKITLRNLRKHPGYTFINISGLAIGVACCLLIMLFVAWELSYDRWNTQASRIVRPVVEIKFGGAHMHLAVVGSPIGPDLKQEFPEVQAYCRFRSYGQYLVKRDGQGQQNIREDDVLTCDSSFFEVFPIKVIEGNPRSCLTQPRTIAISKSRAEKYFGSPQLALGGVLILDNEEQRQVTGVFEDLPENTHFKADLLLAMNGNGEVQNDSPLWATSNNFQTYLLLRPGTDPKDFESKFLKFSRKKTAETAQRMLGQDISELEASGQFVRYSLQPLTSIHLHSDRNVELQANGSIQHVWIFSAIALFVLLIACVNFMNLTTARSAHRSREIGVRKVLGSPRSALIRQFLGESFILATIAVMISIAIAALAMPAFADLTNRPITMPWSNPMFWLTLLGGIGLVSLLAGLYPAFFLSAFDPIHTLKGESSNGQGASNRLRSTLVVFQFATSIALIISTGLVYKQLGFIQQKKLGFQKDQVLILEDAYGLEDAALPFKNQVLQLPAVESATFSSYLPVPSNRSDQTFSKSRIFTDDQSVNMQYWRVDQDYLKTIGLELVSGRFFDPEKHPGDSTAIVLNETAARLFGFNGPGGKVYGFNGQVHGQPKPEDFDELNVIGIVKDFHFSSLRNNIGALSMYLGRSTSNLSIRYKAADTQELLTTLEQKWKTAAPGQPFRPRFMDEAFAQVYATEQRIGKIAGIFALLSILVSCLGLFGLAAFTAERRTKEIGIRRVLGATTAGIVGLLSKEFLKLVVIALVIATPLAWYFMNSWLENFAFRTEMPWWIFALAGLFAVLTAFLIVGFQSIKAALANPVNSLRSE